MDSLNNNVEKNIPFLISIIIMIIGLAYISLSKNLFKENKTKTEAIQTISKALFIFFTLYAVTNIFKYSKNKNLLNIILSFILCLFIGYFSYGKNIFHDDMKFKRIVDIFLDFSFVYSIVWIFLHLLKKQFSSVNNTGQQNKTWNKIGMVSIILSLYIVITTIAIGNVYHKDVTTSKKSMTTILATALFGSSLVIINYLMKQ